MTEIKYLLLQKLGTSHLFMGRNREEIGVPGNRGRILFSSQPQQTMCYISKTGKTANLFGKLLLYHTQDDYKNIISNIQLSF